MKEKLGNLIVGGCKTPRTAAQHSTAQHSPAGDQSLCPVSEDARSPAALARLPPKPSRHYPPSVRFTPFFFFPPTLLFPSRVLSQPGAGEGPPLHSHGILLLPGDAVRTDGRQEAAHRLLSGSARHGRVLLLLGSGGGGSEAPWRWGRFDTSCRRSRWGGVRGAAVIEEGGEG